MRKSWLSRSVLLSKIPRSSGTSYIDHTQPPASLSPHLLSFLQSRSDCNLIFHQVLHLSAVFAVRRWIPLLIEHNPRNLGHIQRLVTKSGVGSERGENHIRIHKHYLCTGIKGERRSSLFNHLLRSLAPLLAEPHILESVLFFLPSPDYLLSSSQRRASCED